MSSKIGIQLQQEAGLLNNTLSDPEKSFFRPWPASKSRAEFYVENFLKKASPYMQNEVLSSSLRKLKQTCHLKGLGDSSVRIQTFVSPILKLPEEMLNAIVEFLPPKDILAVAVTSKASQHSLARGSDWGKLISIARGVPVIKLGLTENSLLSLLRKKQGVKIEFLNLNGLRIENLVALLDLCPEIYNLSAEGCDFRILQAEQIASYQNIRELNLRGNRISDEGARSISKMPKLLKLNLAENYISEALTDQLRQHFQGRGGVFVCWPKPRSFFDFDLISFFEFIIFDY